MREWWQEGEIIDWEGEKCTLETEVLEGEIENVRRCSGMLN